MRWLLIAALACSSLSVRASEVFFDDFSQSDMAALRATGWTLRDKAGHPGVEGARWAPEGISLVNDPEQAGNHLLRLTARTDGTSAGTQQAQLCHARKYLNGTYAARVRFDTSQGGDGLVQTFYAVSPLRFDYDPDYSELDWEYLPYGGWGDAKPRLYGVSWHTVRLQPWDAYNQAHQEWGFLSGWHVLLTQVSADKVRWFLDGRELAEHGGRNHPVVPMAISFSNWFIAGGPFAAGKAAREYRQDVDWVFHAKDQVLNLEQVLAQVGQLRRQGTARIDTVPDTGLPSPCDF